jgi:membrane-associated phospholipid phosphatase
MIILDTIGYFGPQILCVLSVILLFKKWNTLSLYLVGYFSNIIITYILKGIIQEPRPTEDKKLFNIELLHGSGNSQWSGKRIGFDRYGCPSGHASSVVYSTVFLYLVLQNPKILAIYLLVSLVTMYQRVKYKNHSIHQVIIGAVVGFFSAFVIYFYTKHILKGKMGEKPDDNAPL